MSWAAGLFEGEGSIYIDDSDARHRSGKTRIGMSLSSTDEDVIERFRQVVGCGRVYGPYHAKKGTKVYWAWHLRDADEIAQLFKLLGPELGVRRRQTFREVLAAKTEADRTYRPKPIGRPRAIWIHEDQLVIR